MALKTRTLHKAAAAGGDAKIEDYLDAKGVSWEFVPAVMPDQFDTERSLRNQARFQALDEKRVDTYVKAFRRGDEFLAVIAQGRMGKLITADGNHRLQAAMESRPFARMGVCCRFG